MKSEILIVTYAKDLEWLELSLQSIQKFATGFECVKVSVPIAELDQFIRLENKYKTADHRPIQIKHYHEYPNKGMVNAQVMKLYADVLCPDADFIFHIDADCLFHEAVSPSDYIVEGNPVLICTEYDKIPEGRAEHIWRSNAMNALNLGKQDVPYETMQRHPGVFKRNLYPILRSWIERVHKTPFHQYVLEQRNEFPQSFAEFPTIGALAIYLDRKENTKNYEVFVKSINDEPHPSKKHKLTQFWSHARPHGQYHDLYVKQIREAYKIIGL
jgi:Family of unknown function (DUF6492)